jgi:cytochrome c553
MVWLLGMLAACGGRPEPTNVEAPSGSVQSARSAAESTPQGATTTRTTGQSGVVTATTTQRGVLLSGLPGENAFTSVQAYAVGDRESKTARPMAAGLKDAAALKATLDLGATVGQVNAALDAVGARIVSMRPGHKTLALELAPVGGVSLSNQQAAARLLASRAFQWVQGPGLPALPAGVTADPAVSEPEDHDAPTS